MSESDEEYEDIDLKLISRTQSNSVNIQESFTKQRSGNTSGCPPNSTEVLMDNAERKNNPGPPPPPPPNASGQASRPKSKQPLPNPKLVKVKTLPKKSSPGSVSPQTPPAPLPKPFKKSVSSDSLNTKKDGGYVVTENLPFSEVVKNYKDQFPLRVRVSRGHYGPSELTTVSEGDTYTLHFVKHAKVANAMDEYGISYKITLNSAVEFGVVWDGPTEEGKGAEVFFDRVADLLALSSPPKVVRAMKQWRGSGPDSTVEENELFAIQKTSKAKLKNARVLKVYSLKYKKKKILPEHCVGGFSARPYDCRLFLPEITELIRDNLPIKVMLFVNSETAQELPQSLASSMVTIEGFSTETTVVCTTVLHEGLRNDKLVDIPIDLDISVQIMKPASGEQQDHLFEDTKNVLENFNPSHLQPLFKPSEGSNSDIYNTQAALFCMPRKGNEFTGIKVEMPSALYVNSPFISDASDVSNLSTIHQASKSVSPCSVSEDQLISTESPALTLDMMQEKVKGLHEKFTKLDNDTNSIRAEVKQVETGLTRTQIDVAEARVEIAGMKPDIQHIAGTLENLYGLFESMQKDIQHMQKEMQRVDKEMQHLIQKASVPDSQNDLEQPAEAIQNRRYLASLDVEQIINLLKTMGLQQHKEKFMQEMISGEVLLQCDDQMLETELEITSRLHRVRLLKVISGEHSVQNILKGENLGLW